MQTGFGSTTWQDFGFDYIVNSGLKNATTAKDIMLFPNPSHDLLNLNNLNLKEDGILLLQDLCGNAVYSKNINAQQSNIVIDISNLNQGVYFIQITSEKTSIVKKFVKV